MTQFEEMMRTGAMCTICTQSEERKSSTKKWGKCADSIGALRGGYGVEVNTAVCGTAEEGSIPSSHPLRHLDK